MPSRCFSPIISRLGSLIHLSTALERAPILGNLAGAVQARSRTRPNASTQLCAAYRDRSGGAERFVPTVMARNATTNHESAWLRSALRGFASETGGAPGAKDDARNARCHRAMLSIIGGLAYTKFLALLMKPHIAVGFGGETSRACKKVGAASDLLDDRDMSVQGSFDRKALCIPVPSSRPSHRRSGRPIPVGRTFVGTALPAPIQAHRKRETNGEPTSSDFSRHCHRVRRYLRSSGYAGTGPKKQATILDGCG
jgi:hypothetical protein